MLTPTNSFYGLSTSSAIPSHCEKPPLRAPIHQCLHQEGGLSSVDGDKRETPLSVDGQQVSSQSVSSSHSTRPHDGYTAKTAAESMRLFFSHYFNCHPKTAPEYHRGCSRPSISANGSSTITSNSTMSKPDNNSATHSVNADVPLSRSTPPSGHLYYRPLTQSDAVQCEQLHSEWFPMRYDDAFYSAVITGRVFSLAAVYRPAACSKEFDAECNMESDQPEQKEFIAGIITASQEIGNHLRFHDVSYVVGTAEADRLKGFSQPDTPAVTVSETPPPASLNDTARKPVPDSTAFTQYNVKKDIHLAYILTLGVAEGLRGHGIAEDLVRRTVHHFLAQDPDMRAFYLHVADYNQPAIQFYTKLGFRSLLRQRGYYRIQDQPQDAFLYALYIYPGLTIPPKSFLSKKWRWPSFLAHN